VFRKILGIIAGYAAWSVLWLALGSSAQAVSPGSFGEDGSASAGILLVFLAASVVFSLFAGWLAARVGNPAGVSRAPGLWTGLLLLATGLPIQLGSWDAMPLWYHLPFLALLVPAAYLGGSIGRAPARSPRAPVPA